MRVLRIRPCAKVVTGRPEGVSMGRSLEGVQGDVMNPGPMGVLVFYRETGGAMSLKPSLGGGLYWTVADEGLQFKPIAYATLRPDETVFRLESLLDGLSDAIDGVIEIVFVYLLVSGQPNLLDDLASGTDLVQILV